MLSDKIRAWLIFFRAHTAILETPIAVLGAALALGTLWHPDIILWVVFGVMYHFVGYGFNSYADWANGFDKDDPHKKHHPLNTGDIKPSTAKYVTILSLVLMVAYGLVISGLTLVSLACVVVMLGLGSAYNVVGKYTQHKYLLAAGVHTMVFVFPYLTYTTEITMPFLIGISLFFVHHIFQIAVSGDVKDIRQDESSLLQEAGCEIEKTRLGDHRLKTSSNVYGVSMILVAVEVVLAIQNSIIVTMDIHSAFFTSALALVMFTEAHHVVKLGIYDRDKRVSAMSKKELFGIWMICASYGYVIGVTGFLAIVGVSLLYFFPMSKFMWGNWLKPEV